MSRRRSLSEDERALWAGFARSIKPLERQRRPAEPAEPDGDEKEKPAGGPAERQRAAQPQPRPNKQDKAKPAPPLAPLGRRLKQRVARGREPIEARLDLHGMTQAKAHAALLRFLTRARDDDVRIALVVTGKGADKGTGKREATREPGILKRQVPLWLELPQFRALVVGFEDAHIGHGGQGALYVRLRRRR